jgi:hypothetical protein
LGKFSRPSFLVMLGSRAHLRSVSATYTLSAYTTYLCVAVSSGRSVGAGSNFHPAWRGAAAWAETCMSSSLRGMPGLCRGMPGVHARARAHPNVSARYASVCSLRSECVLCAGLRVHM